MVALLVCDQDRAGAIKMKLRIRLELARKLITVMRRVPWKVLQKVQLNVLQNVQLKGRR